MSASSSAEVLLDEQALARAIASMAKDMARRIVNPDDCALVGIRTRGATLAARLQRELHRARGWDLPLGVLDITLYRDDLSQLAEQPLVRSTEIDFDVSGKLIFLVDDVLFTGRTIRSALDALVDFGRPRRIMLGVLVDRGHREFPIQADVAALSLETTEDQFVNVYLAEDDGRDEVVLASRPHD
jgi:pyrimidine operon attenuation protein / uracil phosphoribosyltransferase